MQTDRKIGFALGILLIGVVSALFFRNEPFGDPQMLSVDLETELNRQIANRDISVYGSERRQSAGKNTDPVWTMRGVVEDMRRKQQTAPSPIRDARVAGELNHWNRNSFDGYRTSRSRVHRAQPDTDDQNAAPLTQGEVHEPVVAAPALPQAVRTVVSQSRDEATLAVQENPSERRQSLAVATGVASAADPSPVDPEIPEFDDMIPNARSAVTAQQPETIGEAKPEYQEYEVRYGDTLSGIAERFLGSQGKYRRIYEINRDRMKSPDHLSVGMVLRIPPSQPPIVSHR